jgi:hypothetical protein
MVVTVKSLSDSERRVWDAFPAGTLVDLGSGDEADYDPADADNWGTDRQVSAQVLLALLCGAVKVSPGQAGMIWLKGARIMGKIDLPGAEFRHRLRLERCRIGEGIDLTDATTRTLGLEGCQIGPIYLLRTNIRGALVMTGAQLDGGSGLALTADGLAVRLISTAGEITLNRVALAADGLTVTSGVFCDEEFRAEGEIRLVGASIGGHLCFRGAVAAGLHIFGWLLAITVIAAITRSFSRN